MKKEMPRAYGDMVFKYLFGREESKEQLKAFINAVLEDGDGISVTELEIQNPFNLKEFESDKLSILDLKAKDQKGRTFNLEVQTMGYKDYAYRSLFYWSRIYVSQIKERDDYKILRPVVSINLLNFTLIDGNNRFHNTFQLREKTDPSIILTDHLLIHFLEMPKFNSESNRTLGQWLRYFLHEGKEDGVVKKLSEENEQIAETHRKYESFVSDDQMRMKALAREMGERDHLARMNEAKEEGFKKGHEEGLAIGHAEGHAEGLAEGRTAGLSEGRTAGLTEGIEQGKEAEKRLFAKKCLEQGLDLETISTLTGLSNREIQQL